MITARIVGRIRQRNESPANGLAGEMSMAVSTFVGTTEPQPAYAYHYNAAHPSLLSLDRLLYLKMGVARSDISHRAMGE
jgi:hypothetical protein